MQLFVLVRFYNRSWVCVLQTAMFYKSLQTTIDDRIVRISIEITKQVKYLGPVEAIFSVCEDCL